MLEKAFLIVKLLPFWPILHIISKNIFNPVLGYLYDEA